MLVFCYYWTGPVRSIWIRTGRSLIVDSKELRTKKTETDERSFCYREQLVCLFFIITAQVDVKYKFVSLCVCLTPKLSLSKKRKFESLQKKLKPKNENNEGCVGCVK